MLLKRWIAILVPLVVILGLVGWRLNQKRQETADQARQRVARQNAAINVEVTPATRADIVRRFDAVGTLEAIQAVDITPKVSGPITFLTAREGDRVTAGEVLARIDPAEVLAAVRSRQAAVAQARARLAEAQAAQGANNVGLTSEVSRQRAAVATAQAQAQQALADSSTQVAAAQAAVADAAGRVAAAEAEIAAAGAAVQAAEANLANARTKEARQESLFKEGATAKELLDDARTATLVAEGALKEARQRQKAGQAASRSAQAQQKAASEQVRVAQNKTRADIAVSQAAVRQNQAILRGAQANTGRQQAYQSNLQALSAAVAAAEADLRASQAQLGDTVLRSPIDGVVTRRYRDAGSLASPSAPILAVQSIRRLWATIPVPEEVSRRVSVGQTASVALDAFPGKNFTGRIARIEPAADPTSRQFTVRVELDNAAGRLHPGTFARVTVVTQRASDALSVPLEAVKKTPANGATVTVVGADSTAQNRPVKTGLSDARRIAITEGLREGDQVVILSGRPLKDGQKVKAGGDTGNGAAGAAPAQDRQEQGASQQNQETRR